MQNYADSGVMGAKNLLPLVLSDIKSYNTSGTWSDNVYSYRGVDFTINTDDDGNITSIVADGTATDGESRLTMKYVSQTDYQGKLLNGCPSGGAATLYSLGIQRTTSPYTFFSDYGDGCLIGDIGATGTIFISIKKDCVASDLTFYPMIRLATDSDDTFQPYAKTNLQLTTAIGELETAMNGAYFATFAYYTTKQYMTIETGTASYSIIHIIGQGVNELDINSTYSITHAAVIVNNYGSAQTTAEWISSTSIKIYLGTNYFKGIVMANTSFTATLSNS